MPLYEYYCPPCGTRFELLRPRSQMDDAATCPSGHITNNRVLSLFAPPARSAAVAVEAPQLGADACNGIPGHFGCNCC